MKIKLFENPLISKSDEIDKCAALINQLSDKHYEFNAEMMPTLFEINRSSGKETYIARNLVIEHNYGENGENKRIILNVNILSYLLFQWFGENSVGAVALLDKLVTEVRAQIRRAEKGKETVNNFIIKSLSTSYQNPLPEQDNGLHKKFVSSQKFSAGIIKYFGELETRDTSKVTFEMLQRAEGIRAAKASIRATKGGATRRENKELHRSPSGCGLDMLAYASQEIAGLDFPAVRPAPSPSPSPTSHSMASDLLYGGTAAAAPAPGFRTRNPSKKAKEAAGIADGTEAIHTKVSTKKRSARDVDRTEEEGGNVWQNYLDQRHATIMQENSGAAASGRAWVPYISALPPASLDDAPVGASLRRKRRASMTAELTPANQPPVYRESPVAPPVSMPNSLDSADIFAQGYLSPESFRSRYQETGLTQSVMPSFAPAYPSVGPFAQERRIQFGEEFVLTQAQSNTLPCQAGPHDFGSVRKYQENVWGYAIMTSRWNLPSAVYRPFSTIFSVPEGSPVLSKLASKLPKPYKTEGERRYSGIMRGPHRDFRLAKEQELPTPAAPPHITWGERIAQERACGNDGWVDNQVAAKMRRPEFER